MATTTTRDLKVRAAELDVIEARVKALRSKVDEGEEGFSELERTQLEAELDDVEATVARITFDEVRS